MARWTRSLVLFSGLLASVATSPGGGWDTGWEERTTIQGQAFVRNDGAEPLLVQVRDTQQAELSCEELAQDPGGLLVEGAFGSYLTYRLEQGEVLALGLSEGWGCSAVLLDGEGVPGGPRLAWLGEELDPLWTSWGEIPDERTLALGGEEIVDEGGLLVPWSPLPEERGESCEIAPDGQRLYWSPELEGSFWIAGVSEGLDGCLALDIAERNSDSYVCMPPHMWPFESGQELRFSAVSTGLRVSGEGYVLTLSNGSGWPAQVELPEGECDWVPEAGCGTVSRALEAPPQEGEDEAGLGWSFEAVHLEDIVLANPSCDGHSTGLDLEWVLIEETD